MGSKAGVPKVFGTHLLDSLVWDGGPIGPHLTSRFSKRLGWFQISEDSQEENLGLIERETERKLIAGLVFPERCLPGAVQRLEPQR